MMALFPDWALVVGVAAVVGVLGAAVLVQRKT